MMTCSPTAKRIISLSTGGRHLLRSRHSGPTKRTPFPVTWGREGRRTSSRSGFVASAATPTAPATVARLAIAGAAALFSWPSFVHRERSPADFVAVFLATLGLL